VVREPLKEHSRVPSVRDCKTSRTGSVPVIADIKELEVILIRIEDARAV
jgi:hypothetical protein